MRHRRVAPPLQSEREIAVLFHSFLFYVNLERCQMSFILSRLPSAPSAKSHPLLGISLRRSTFNVPLPPPCSFTRTKTSFALLFLCDTGSLDGSRLQERSFGARQGEQRKRKVDEKAPPFGRLAGETSEPCRRYSLFAYMAFKAALASLFSPSSPHHRTCSPFPPSPSFSRRL